MEAFWRRCAERSGKETGRSESQDNYLGKKEGEKNVYFTVSWGELVGVGAHVHMCLYPLLESKGDADLGQLQLKTAPRKQTIAPGKPTLFSWWCASWTTHLPVLPGCQPVVCFWSLWEALFPTFSVPFLPRFPWSCPNAPGSHVDLSAPSPAGQKGGIWVGWKKCSLQ